MEINTIANTTQHNAAIQRLYIISGPYPTICPILPLMFSNAILAL
jgi:hypothetical protein